MRRLLVLLLLAVGVLAGCADAIPPPPVPSPDAAYLGAMVPHHAQALELAALVPGRGASPAVAGLATRIDRDQVEEIGQLEGLRRSRGWPAGDGAHAHGMDGMADAATLEQLRALRGPAFDRLWLATMTRHHEGAIAMAREHLATGADETLRRFSQALVGTQTGEIDAMRAAATSVAGP
ncbi:DUF305 domain-containing protein [Actinomycetospora sp. CA-101289]|uniref:DUF305 domain-containing protein n=1 Tax=Actinomycetospora sp. CA-101289 TaxID=3239893 RepID=UPI003D965057